MIDFDRIAGFDWDEGNRRKSVDKHDVALAEAEQVFLNQPLLILADERHSHDEPRYHALGQTDAGRRLHVTFTLRHDRTRIRVISARDMHRKERDLYDTES
ncbi:MAG: BrnT family toxin [Rhodospirillales bacterium]|nr:BrnT family toxin [Rhodospirillales bacterium]